MIGDMLGRLWQPRSRHYGLTLGSVVPATAELLWVRLRNGYCFHSAWWSLSRIEYRPFERIHSCRRICNALIHFIPEVYPCGAGDVCTRPPFPLCKWSVVRDRYDALEARHESKEGGPSYHCCQVLNWESVVNHKGFLFMFVPKTCFCPIMPMRGTFVGEYKSHHTNRPRICCGYGYGICKYKTYAQSS